ncbi:sensor histidine kinase [Parasphingorhabdus sp.]
MLLFAFPASGSAQAVIDLGAEREVPNLLDRTAPIDRSLSGDIVTAKYALEIHNSGTETAIIRLKTEEAARVGILVVLRQGELEEQLIQSRPRFRDIESLSSQNQQLASRPISVAASETLTLDITARAARGDTPFPITLISEADFVTSKVEIASTHGVYFGAALFVVAIASGFAMLLRSRIIMFFALYTGTLVLLNLHTYGYAASYLPEFVQTYHDAIKRMLRQFWVLFYFLFAANFTQAAKNAPRVYRFGIAVAIAAFINGIIGITIAPPISAVLMVILGGAFLITTGVLVGNAVRQRVIGARLFLIGFLILLSYAFVTIRAGFPDMAEHNDLVDAIALGLLVVDSLVFAAAIIAQVKGIMNERDAARDAELAASMERAAAADRLAQAYVDRDEAREKIIQSRQQLAETRHDLRQPLVGLRSALSGIDPENQELRRAVGASVDYIDALLKGTMFGSSDQSDKHRSSVQKTETSGLKLAQHFATLKQMFGAEAAASGNKLEFAETDSKVMASPVALLRILSNLIDNAIQYAPGTLINISTGEDGGSAWIEICDGGDGIPETGAPESPERDTGLERGYGLNIVRAIAAKEGFELEYLGDQNGARWRVANIPVLRSQKSTAPD